MSEALLVAAPARPPAPTETGATACQNCGTPLAGPYCASCGQRHEPHIHSVPHFVAEAAETLTHADSRLWRTLGHLLTRPGRLTREFLAGRRARYLPPFRLYVVVSLLYFVLIAVLPDAPAPVRFNLGDAPVAETANGEAATAEAAAGDNCTGIEYDGPGDTWLEPALKSACDKATADGGAGLTSAFMANVPRALFVFLPLIAAVALLLYWRPRRHYVEHLLFFLHNHSAVFVVLGLHALVSALTGAIPGASVVDTPLAFAVAGYLLWYPYRALRSVYGQSRGRSVAKYFVLGFAYLVLGGVMLLVTAVYSALTL
jgi:hypothetical protein